MLRYPAANPAHVPLHLKLFESAIHTFPTLTVSETRTALSTVQKMKEPAGVKAACFPEGYESDGPVPKSTHCLARFDSWPERFGQPDAAAEPTYPEHAANIRSILPG